MFPSFSALRHLSLWTLILLGGLFVYSSPPCIRFMLFHQNPHNGFPKHTCSPLALCVLIVLSHSCLWVSARIWNHAWKQTETHTAKELWTHMLASLFHSLWLWLQLDRSSQGHYEKFSFQMPSTVIDFIQQFFSLLVCLDAFGHPC